MVRVSANPEPQASRYPQAYKEKTFQPELLAPTRWPRRRGAYLLQSLNTWPWLPCRSMVYMGAPQIDLKIDIGNHLGVTSKCREVPRA